MAEARELLEGATPKDCPFCATALRLCGVEWPWIHIAPEGEGCHLHRFELQDQDDVNFWNMRAPDPQVIHLTEQLAEVRMRIFLEILASMGGTSCASDEPWCWCAAFCEEHEGKNPDTFNQAIDAGYVDWSHDVDTDHSEIRLTDKGRAILAQGDKA